MKVEMVPIIALKSADYNPRVMPPKEMDDLVRSIKEFGFVEPVVANRNGNTVIGGHQRLEAAMRLKIDKVPVIFVELSESKERALNIALNKIHGFFDEHLVAEVLKNIEKEDRELSGYSPEEEEALLKKLMREDDDVGTDNPGLGAKLEVTCPQCGHQFKFAKRQDPAED